MGETHQVSDFVVFKSYQVSSLNKFAGLHKCMCCLQRRVLAFIGAKKHRPSKFWSGELLLHQVLFSIRTNHALLPVRCLCPKANPSLTLGRLVKRMKLCFSKTIASGLLPEGSVEVFPDIKSPNGSVMTDGCGLVSKRALLAIWDAYWQESVIRGESDRPPVMCTSFQGRLGGFKGTWVLSEALGYEQEFRIVCTESQLKFNLPQKCLRTCPHTGGWDPAYDTMEVCRWNSAMEEAPLNNRLIQCLESRAFGENAKKLQDLLENWYALRKLANSCNTDDNIFHPLYQSVNDRCRQLTDLKDPSKWFRFTLKKNRQTPQEDEKGVGCTDTKMLFEMSVCGVEQTDPTFVRRRKRLLAHEFKNMRKKVR